ncbi:AI-2E family transporter [Rhodobaculum claviforme]|uniref:AI-2E family transporter n=1 Tax=Rhodobaculum claviforme TaxID=1549854 RepID=A0A934TMZ7_9RHOB|nr:AI-2E family transporter [Rhodobaculum claviforme]MBK5928795.1 AI-2E family transporter [Rhodobaculum claviforme]
MALPTGMQLKYWGIAGGGFLVALWLLGDVIAPFLAGAAVAYFLNPLVERLEARGLSRMMATVLITLVVMAAVAVALLGVVPGLIAQAVALFEAAPDGLQAVHRFLEVRFPDALDADSAVRRGLAGMGEAVQSRGMALVEGALSSARGLLGVLVFVVITPVVAFYLLMDWPRLVARIDDLLPRDHAPVIRRLAHDIDRAVAGFVRGQLSVCLILAVFYATALVLVGLQFGLVVGVVTGLISFIPWIGAIIGGILSIGLALHQFWGAPGMIALVAGIFVLGQFLEGNVLVPRMVGRSVGLHPVWLLLALSAFGSLFGFAGMLVAVPVAAALGVVVRFFTQQYHDSVLYRGSGGR